MDELLISFGLAAGTTIITGPVIIYLLKKFKASQSVRRDGPSRHLSKTGTPTMGGILFLSGLTLAVLVINPLSPLALSALILTWGFAVIGFTDDALKVIFHRPLGLLARQKLGGQVFLGIVAGSAAMLWLDRGSVIVFPATTWQVDLGWYYPLFAAFVMVATANAVNLTDGLDGLAAGVSLFVAVAFAFVALSRGQPEIAVFAMALAGGCLGFLVYNFFPAKVFMGDTGSLALGAAVGFMAVTTGTELLLPVLGGIYVLETLSVILQVVFFRLTGKRIFLMSPLHHHFELKGWHETKVVFFFWIIAVISALSGIYIFTI